MPDGHVTFVNPNSSQEFRFTFPAHPGHGGIMIPGDIVKAFCKDKEEFTRLLILTHVLPPTAL